MADRMDRGFAAEETARLKEEAVRKLEDSIAGPLMKLTGAQPGTPQADSIQECAGMIARYVTAVDKQFITERIQEVLPAGDKRLNIVVNVVEGIVNDHLKPTTPAAPAPQARATVAPAAKNSPAPR